MIGKDEYKEYFEKLEEEKRQAEIKRAEIEERYQLYKVKYDLLIRFVPEAKMQILPDDKQEACNKMAGCFFVWYHQKIGKNINGAILKRLMDDKGISVREMSEKTKKSQSAIRSWINEKSSPEIGSYIELAIALDCNIEKLFKNKI